MGEVVASNVIQLFNKNIKELSENQELAIEHLGEKLRDHININKKELRETIKDDRTYTMSINVNDKENVLVVLITSGEDK